MSDAKAILATRLARGEISEEDYDRIISKLGNEASLTSNIRFSPNNSSTPPASRHTIRRIGKLLYWLLWIDVILISAFNFIVAGKPESAAFEYNGIEFTQPEVMAGLVILGFFATALLFLFWKYRATQLLVDLRGPQTVTPLGAAYWYFVPVAWFWKPYEAMRNLIFGLNTSIMFPNAVLLVWWLSYWGGWVAELFGEGQTAALLGGALHIACAFATQSLVKAITDSEVKSAVP